MRIFSCADAIRAYDLRYGFLARIQSPHGLRRGFSLARMQSALKTYGMVLRRHGSHPCSDYANNKITLWSHPCSDDLNHLTGIKPNKGAKSWLFQDFCHVNSQDCLSIFVIIMGKWVGFFQLILFLGHSEVLLVEKNGK